MIGEEQEREFACMVLEMMLAHMAVCSAPDCKLNQIVKLAAEWCEVEPQSLHALAQYSHQIISGSARPD